MLDVKKCKSNKLVLKIQTVLRVYIYDQFGNRIYAYTEISDPADTVRFEIDLRCAYRAATASA